MKSDPNIGEKFSVGSAVVAVTEPRTPCYKLAIKFGRPDIVKRFLASERTGFYFAVLREGDVGRKFCRAGCGISRADGKASAHDRPLWRLG